MTVPANHPLLRELAELDRSPKSLAAPSISADVQRFLRAGLVQADLVTTGRADPFFAYAGSSTYRCRNALCETRMLVQWGNTDGYGIEDETDVKGGDR